MNNIEFSDIEITGGYWKTRQEINSEVTLKSVYDTNDDGKVDEADQADSALNVGGKTAAQVATAVDNSHSHSNKTTLDKLGESSGKLTFNGAEIGGGTAGSVAWDDVTGKPSTFPPADHTHEISDVNGLQSALDGKGTVKSVNGVQPDSSGNVTVETGSTVDESRLLPDPQSISSEKSGLPLVFKSDYKADSSFILCFPFDGDIVDYSTNRVQVTNDYVTLASDVPEGSGQSAYFNASACLRGTLPVVLGTSDLTINAWIKLQHTGSNQTFFSTRNGNASSSEAFSFDVHDDGELFMYSTSEHTSRISSAEKMTFGEWHHVRMIRSSTTVKLYLDGKLHAEGTCSNDWTWTAFAIGMLYRENDSYNQLKGYMSAFQLLNYAMPIEEFTPVFDYGIDINKWFEVAEDNLCDDAITAHNSDPSAHPDKLPLSGGTLTGELKSTAFNAFRMIQGEYGTFFRNDGNSLYLMITNAGDQNGSYNDFRPLTINLSTGRCDINGSAVYDGSGKNIAETYVVKNHPTFNSGIEISGDVPYIDFHFRNDTSDYTSRIYETAAGTLTVTGLLSVKGGIAPRYNAQTDITSAYTSGGNSYTFTGGGWLYAVTSAGGSYAINGGTVVSAASGATASCCVPVNKGDTVTGSAAGTLIFYPY